uniref:Uncharacterized protein n=1 Tax=Arundo donax TaxID=35708 RepID=A0A0A9B171_ARUDO
MLARCKISCPNPKAQASAAPPSGGQNQALGGAADPWEEPRRRAAGSAVAIG